MEVASRKRRIFSFLVDHILFSMIAAFAAFGTMGQGWDVKGFDDFSSIGATVLVIMLIYLAKDSFCGQSIGKRIFGIKVVLHTDEAIPPSILRGFARNILIFIWPIELLVLAFSKKKRRLGDMLASTKVIKLEGNTRKVRLKFMILVLALMIPAFLLTTSKVIKNSEAYRVATLSLMNNGELVNTIGKVKEFGFFPTGSINVTNGHGLADLNLSIDGEISSTDVNVNMEMLPGSDWKIRGVTIAQ